MHRFFLFLRFSVFLCLQLSALVDALTSLLLKDKAWVKTALGHLRNSTFGDSAGGRVQDAAATGGNEQRRRLFGFDLGKSVGLELAPTVQMLAQLLLCSQGEEVRSLAQCFGVCPNYFVAIIVSIDLASRNDGNLGFLDSKSTRGQ